MQISSFNQPDRSVPSRRRSLVRDVCESLQQQMFFWGCDIRWRDGNLLMRYGMTRHAREEGSPMEGSSRYRMAWRDGTLELHSFHAGWYPHFGEGVVFIRNRERIYPCSSEEPLTPGAFGEEFVSTTDGMLQACRPLVEWVCEYELWVQSNTPSGYREKCWIQWLSRKGSRPWLPPAEAGRWRKKFLTDPFSTPRARDFVRTNSNRFFHLPSHPSPLRRSAK
jgi:hypothetical protein